MTMIVTGGAGLIGGNFIFHMTKTHPEERIICLDKLTYAGYLSTLAPVMEKDNFRFVKEDICDRETVCWLFEEERPDLLFTEDTPLHTSNPYSSSKAGMDLLALDHCIDIDLILQKGVSEMSTTSAAIMKCAISTS